MTEIPEHLLKRARERRAALSGEPAEGAAAPEAAATASSSSPATTAAAAVPAKPAAPVAPAPPPPPKPDPPYVAAAKQRAKIPVWAMGALSLLPLFGFMYVRGLTPEPVVIRGPVGDGATVYTRNCSSCHLGKGQGGSGRKLAEGEVLKTFPKIEDQLNFVYTGSDPYNGRTYGDPNRPGGPHIGVTQFGAKMPNFGADTGGPLTDAEILAAVCHERYTLSGADEEGDGLEAFEKWCSEDSEIYVGLQDGTMTFADLDGVGTEPRGG